MSHNAELSAYSVFQLKCISHKKSLDQRDTTILDIKVCWNVVDFVYVDKDLRIYRILGQMGLNGRITLISGLSYQKFVLTVLAALQ